jgi:hypothetical protein
MVGVVDPDSRFSRGGVAGVDGRQTLELIMLG